MKKLTYCLVAIVMALSTACNNENSSEHKNLSNPEADLNEINELLIEITPNLACVISPWTYAFITEKLSDQTQIKLGVILKQE